VDPRSAELVLERLYRSVEPTRMGFVMYLSRRADANLSVLKKSLKMSLVAQIFVFIQGEWCVVNP
jgi:hypothetical protein